MNTGTKQYEEFVFRRTTEPIPFFGFDLPGGLWIFILIVVLLVGFIYVGIMYLRDSKGVGILWAGVLGLLRTGVYLAIAFIFLLPSRQSWEEKTATSKVMVLFDVSGSMVVTRDDLPRDGQDFTALPTRSQKMLKFLENQDVKFLKRLEAKNPVTIDRFARYKDGDFLYLADGRSFTKEEKLEFDDQMKRPEATRGDIPPGRPLAPEILQLYLTPNPNRGAPLVDTPDTLSQPDGERFAKIAERNKLLASKGFFMDTNVGQAVLDTVKGEVNNMVQGIVIFTDGHSTEGSISTLEAIAEQCKAADPPIPLFVVGIGEDRPHVRIEIADLRAPQQVQPEDHFRIVMEVTGEGLPDQEFLAGVDFTHVHKGDDGKETNLPIKIVEQDDPKNPKPPKDRATIDLGEKVTLMLPKPPKFDKASNPPRKEIEFLVDAATLAKAAGKDNTDLFKSKKWELGETKTPGGDPTEYRFQGRVAKDPQEIFPDKEHKSDPVDLRVIKRPVRVLLFSAAATHDFQFVNNMFIREAEKQRASLDVYVQPPPGKDAAEWIQQVVLGVQKEHLLVKFPDRYDEKGGKPEDDKYDLTSYDVIIAFDPDWTRLTDDQLKKVKTWVDKGGGLIMVGGPINTIQLARPGQHAQKLAPILELLPVKLKDVRIEALDRKTDDPWVLKFPGATEEMEFLKLAEEGEKGPPKFLSDWEEFFWGKEGPKAGPPKRGFFNYYPADSVVPGSIIVATFGDPKAKMKNGDPMPWMVLSDKSVRRVVWIAWGETRRLRQHSEAFHERFWTKLARYAGAGNQASLNNRVVINMSRTFNAMRYVQVDAVIDDKGGKKLEVKHAGDMPTVHLKLPAGIADEQKIPEDYKMQARPTPRGSTEDDKGRFSLRFQVKAPGEYELKLTVPETGDTKTQKFIVKESNPELDNPRPDFEQLWSLASEADAVLNRLPEADRQAVKTKLLQSVPALEKKDDAGAPADKAKPAGKEGKMRLYFNLSTADVIPSCMVTSKDTKQIKGPYRDIWDGGWDIFGILSALHIPVWLRNGLVVIVGLLSAEWLIRKLLRLA
jgi:hypothetical protein